MFAYCHPVMNDLIIPGFCEKFCDVNYLGDATTKGVKIVRSETGPLRATAGPRETFLWAPKHFHRASLGRKFLNFFFKMVHSGALCFWMTAGPLNLVGPRVAYPLPHPLDRPG